MDIFLIPAIVTIYTGLNIVSFAFFSYDKFRAKVKGWRIPENVLLVVAAPGPFGALIAMTGFRHKTRQVKFFLVPAFAILHTVLIMVIWQRLL